MILNELKLFVILKKVKKKMNHFTHFTVFDHNFTVYINNHTKIIGSYDLEFFSELRHELKNLINQLIVAEYQKYGNNNLSQKLIKCIDQYIQPQFFLQHLHVKLIK